LCRRQQRENLKMTNKRRPLVQIYIREGGTSNLVANRWRNRRLTRQEEAELVGRAKVDERSATELLLRSHGFVLDCIGRYNIPPPRQKKIDNQKVLLIDDRFDDLVATGVLAALDALRLFDLELGWRFNTYARKLIAGEIADEYKRLLRRGIAGESCADRYAYHHPVATAEQVAYKVNCSLLKAEEALDRLKAFRALDDYNTTEPFKAADDNAAEPFNRGAESMSARTLPTSSVRSSSASIVTN
jgi:Sigma-70 region 2